MSFSVLSCVTSLVSLNPEAISVEIVSGLENNKYNYKSLGEISASDGMGSGMLGFNGSDVNVNNMLKNEAAKKGGNIVLITNSRASGSGAVKNAIGIVYIRTPK